MSNKRSFLKQIVNSIYMQIIVEVYTDLYT